MLAPDEEGRSIAATGFSLASEIVELVVLTGDEIFLQTLREAVGGSRRLWHVPTSDKVSDLLVAGGVGILVLDVQTLNETASLFIAQIKSQFPDLIVVVAGSREAEAALARAISEGTVYRFIHKPVSPGRARLFADAAVRKYAEHHRRNGAVVAVAATTHRGLLIGAACAALCLVLGGIGFLRDAARDERDSRQAVKTAPTQPATPLLARAANALAANRLTAPDGDGALELYLQALARNPTDADARAGLAEVRERLLTRAENALLEERLDEASAAVESARKAGAQGGRLALLSVQLARARGQLKAPPVPVRTDAAGAATAAAAPDAAAANHDLDMALAQQAFLSNVVDASGLTPLTSVRPAYPSDAQKNAVEGSVDMEFTIAENGAVRDIAVLAADPPGVFEQAAVSALSQWRYQPVVRGAGPIARRAHIRIRFALER